MFSQTAARAWLSPFIGSISIVRHETVQWRNRLNTLKLTRESAADSQSLHVTWNYCVTIIAGDVKAALIASRLHASFV